MEELVEPKLASQTEIDEALINFLTEENYQRAVNYVIIKLNYLFDKTFNLEMGIYSNTVEDIIQLACEAISNPKRRGWNKQEYPQFNKFFFSVLRSTISNTLKKELKKEKRTKSIEKENKNGEVQLRVNPVEEFPAGEQSESSYKVMIKKLEDDLYELGADITEVLYFEEHYINKTKRLDIAKLLEVTPYEITLIKKRLDRKLITLRPKWIHHRL